MMNVINTWDTSLFLFLNGIHNPYFDTFMFLFSNKWIWVPFYASVIFLAVKAWKKQSLIIILALVLCIVIADQVSSGIIKSLVERPRPSREPSLEGLVHIVNNYRGGRFGFVSSHAANAFGFALLSSSLFRRKVYTIFVFLWAATASYSRIYLGVHYPLDIAGGIIVGFFAAWLCRMLLSIIPWRVPNMPKSRSAFIPVLTLCCTVLAITVYSFIRNGWWFAT